VFFQGSGFESLGVCHGDELSYLFKPKLPGINDSTFLRTPQDASVSKQMVQMWVNFAKTSNPTPNPQSKLSVTFTFYDYQLKEKGCVIRKHNVPLH
jgi:carboxylesterase type B